MTLKHLPTIRNKFPLFLMCGASFSNFCAYASTTELKEQELSSKPSSSVSIQIPAAAGGDLNQATSIKKTYPQAYLDLIQRLDQAKARYKVVDHAAEGQCEKVSDIRGSTLKQSAKAILIASKIKPKAKESSYYLLVLSAAQQVDFKKVQAAISGSQSVRMASPEKAQELTGCVMGAIPPFAFHPNLTLIVDPELVKDKEMLMAFNAGRLDGSIFLNVEDYLKITTPKIAQISKETDE